MRALVLLLTCGPLLGLLAAGEPASKTKEAAVARKIYVGKCSKCHRFYEPKDYEEADWQRWMLSMNRKSKLKPDQAEVLGRYLDAYRAGQIAGKPQDKPKPQ